MKIIRSIAEMRQFLATSGSPEKKTALVPTMGALHAGHMELVRQSKKYAEVTVCSIFVNPVQFNNPDDLAKYPRNEEIDIRMLDSAGCEVVFIPNAGEMYPNQEAPVKFDFGVLERTMEGEFRPGHFSGVGLVVSKLLNIVSPDVALFGKKDLQQLAVVRKLVWDLNIKTQIIGVETVREPSGLALSSRNQLLSGPERERAAVIYQSLTGTRDQLLKGMGIDEAKSYFMSRFSGHRDFTVEYIQIVCEHTMQPVERIEKNASYAICTAVKVGGVRLIDNITFDV